MESFVVTSEWQKEDVWKGRGRRFVAWGSIQTIIGPSAR